MKLEGLPKIIWIYWHQGFIAAPKLVRMCVLSWKIRNPDFRIEVLDKHSIKKFLKIPSNINLQRGDLSIQIYSDYLRLALLNKYGGIWVDAYCYCLYPVSNWLKRRIGQGIFMFKNCYAGRIIASWFIAATPKNYIIRKWFLRFQKYLECNSFRKIDSNTNKSIQLFLERLFNSDERKTTYWFSFVVRKVFKLYPYFALHYLFNLLYLSDKRFRERWNKVEKVDSGLFAMTFQPVKGVIFKEFINLNKKGKIPLFKLAHQLDFNNPIYSQYIQLIHKDFKQLQENKNF